MDGIELITVGREILMGTTQDGNSFWLAGEISRMGGRVTRITAVDDDVKEIACAIKDSLGRGAECVITTGGLGPTFDDVTLKGVAEAAGAKLQLHEGALAFLKRRYRHFYRQGYVESAEMNAAREKMAFLPEGAEMLRNPVGAAPGVSLRCGDCTIVSLPGVPAEMKAIYEGSVRRLLRSRLAGTRRWQGRFRSGIADESKMAEAIEGLVRKYQGVHIKSRPETFGRETNLEIEITAEGRTWGEAKKKGEKVERELTEKLEIR